MPDIALDLRYLRYAMFVADLGSFRRAADALQLSQSTVSRRIQLLERRLGVPVFERSASGTRLTPAGERFLREAALGAEHLDRAALKLRQVQRGHAGELRVGVMGSLAGGFLSDLFCHFRRRFPEVGVMLEEASSRSHAAGVSTGRLDVAFISGDHRLPGCNARQLWEEQIFVVLPSTHPLSSNEKVAWPEIRTETFIVSADGPGPEVEDYLIRQLSRVGFRPRIEIQKVSHESLLNLVARGFGITLTIQSTVGVPYGGLTFVPIDGNEVRVMSSVIWPMNSQNPALKKLLELCFELAKGRGSVAPLPS